MKNKKEKSSDTVESGSGALYFVLLGILAAAAIIGAVCMYSMGEQLAYADFSAQAAEYRSVIKFTEAKKELSVPEIVKKAKPSVVGISSEFGGDTVGTGTGIILSADGYIVTNAHVVLNNTENGHTAAEQVTVVPYDRTEYTAEIIGADSRTDLAVLKIDTGGAELSAAEFGESVTLSEGELAVAIGNPLGFELYGSTTCGIISALNRTITIGEYEMKLIQTDAAINPGNSGGPLLNSFGQVIGINSSKIISDYAEGLGFAIPISAAKPVIDELIGNGYVTGRAYIGINGEDVGESNARYYDLPEGVYVRYIEKNSAAEACGIKIGDIIVAADGKDIRSMEELNRIKEGFGSGESITLTVFRDGENVEIKLVLGEDKATRK